MVGWWAAREYAKTPATEARRFHILSGAIFPIYDKIMGCSGIHRVKIARAMLADGRALVGLNLGPSDVPNVKQRLGIGTPLGEASPAEILGLLAGGSIIELDNGWQLTTGWIAGDDVVEVVLNGVPANRSELEAYGLDDTRAPHAGRQRSARRFTKVGREHRAHWPAAVRALSLHGVLHAVRPGDERRIDELLGPGHAQERELALGR